MGADEDVGTVPSRPRGTLFHPARGEAIEKWDHAFVVTINVVNVAGHAPETQAGIEIRFDEPRFDIRTRRPRRLLPRVVHGPLPTWHNSCETKAEIVVQVYQSGALDPLG
ncbi:MAG TPA: hypothetical protein VMW65_04475 [Chloroflexota bacterium]|nr:hypothetical protein [Chloroflexota bacterium]